MNKCEKKEIKKKTVGSDWPIIYAEELYNVHAISLELSNLKSLKLSLPVDTFEYI